MSDFSENAGYAASASYQRLSDLGTGASIGASKMLSDIGGLMPRAAGINNNQHIQAHHGMYSNRMSFFGDAKALMGWGTPRNVSTYQHQQMAYADMGERLAGGAVFGGMHTVGGIGAAGLSMGMIPSAKAGWTAGKTWGAAKLASKGMGVGTAMTVGAGAVGVAGAAAAMIPGLLAVYGAEKAVEAVVADVQDRQQVSKFLEASSWRYTPTHGKDIDSKRGGFSRSARGDIAEDIKQYDYKNSSYDMKDLKGILEGGTELGMFNGAQDAKDFGKKFKELADTLKTVTKTLHTSLAEGMKVIKSLKGAGIGAGDITGAMMQSDVLGMASGNTAAEMLSYGTQGAEMVRGTGVATSAGFNMMQAGMTSTTLGARSGTLSAGSVEQAGGIGALAQQTMGSHMNFMNSGMGRGLMLAASSKDGTLDSAAVSNLLNGGMSLSEVAGAAKGNVGNSGDYIKNLVNQGSRRRELSQKFGGRGMEIMALSGHVMNARQIASDHDVDDLTAFKMSMKQSGASDSVIDNSVSMFKNLENEKKAVAVANGRKSREVLGEMATQKMDWTGRISDRAYKRTIGAVGAVANKTYNDIASWGEETMSSMGDSVNEFMTGTKLVDLKSMTKNERITAMLSGSPEEKIEVDAKLESSNFSAGEAKNFGKTRDYSDIQARVGRKKYTHQAANANTVGQYSKAIFGKDFGELSREEKMYMNVNINRVGSESLKESFDERISTDLSKRDKAMGDYLEGKLGKEEDLKAELSSGIAGVLGEKGMIELGMERGRMNKNQVSNALGGIAQADKKGFISLLKQKEKIANLEEQKISMKGKGNFNEEALTNAKNELKEMGLEFIGKAAKSGDFDLQELGATQAIGTLTTTPITDKERAALKASGKLDALEKAKGRSQMAVMGNKAMDNYLRVGTSSDKLDASEGTKFSKLLAKFKAGEADDDELEDLEGLSNKAGVSGLSNTLKFGSQFDKASGGKQMDFDKFETFLKDSRGIKLTDDQKKHIGKKWRDGVTKDEAMEFMTGISQTTEGKAAFGGLGTSGSRENEAKLMNELSKVQNRTAEVYGLLDILADKILAKTK